MVQVGRKKTVLTFQVNLFCVVNETATSGSGDFDLQSRVETFPSSSANGTEKCVSITVNSDNLVESQEEFTVSLDLVTTGTNLHLSIDTSTVTLIDGEGTLFFGSTFSQAIMLILFM